MLNLILFSLMIATITCGVCGWKCVFESNKIDFGILLGVVLWMNACSIGCFGFIIEDNYNVNERLHETMIDNGEIWHDTSTGDMCYSDNVLYIFTGKKRDEFKL